MPGGVKAFGRCIGHGGMPVDLPPAEPLHDYTVEFVESASIPTTKISRSVSTGSRK